MNPTPLTATEFADQVLAIVGRPEFDPHAYYDPDGDCIEFVARPDPFYAERVDELVTVYISEESGEIVGSLLKGVSRFCKKVLQEFPGFQIEIEDGRVKLAALFRAKAWTNTCPPKEVPTITYKKLIDMAEESAIETQLC
ncbi:MAG: hypothetical protein ACRC7O_00875 [Fimbriiglobus sp.]